MYMNVSSSVQASFSSLLFKKLQSPQKEVDAAATCNALNDTPLCNKDLAQFMTSVFSLLSHIQFIPQQQFTKTPLSLL